MKEIKIFISDETFKDISALCEIFELSHEEFFQIGAEGLIHIYKDLCKRDKEYFMKVATEMGLIMESKNKDLRS